MLALIRLPLLAVAFLLANLALLIVCVLRPFHRDNVHFAGKAYSSVSRVVGLKIVVEKDPAFKNNSSYVYIANHQNSWDLFTICKAAQRGVVTIGKKSIKWIPIFGQMYVLSGNIMIDRGNTGKAKETLSKAAKKIKKRGLSVWMFPEGTRSNGRGLLPFKTGAIRLAQETNEPVVMVCGSSLHKKIKLNRWDNGTMYIRICAPEKIDSSKSPREWADYFHSKMDAELAKLNHREDN